MGWLLVWRALWLLDGGAGCCKLMLIFLFYGIFNASLMNTSSLTSTLSFPQVTYNGQFRFGTSVYCRYWTIFLCLCHRLLGGMPEFVELTGGADDSDVPLLLNMIKIQETNAKKSRVMDWSLMEVGKTAAAAIKNLEMMRNRSDPNSFGIAQLSLVIS